MGRRIGFIGAGQMARALARGFVASGQAAAEQIAACDPSLAALDDFTAAVPGVRRADDHAAVMAGAEIVFLAVKPQHLPAAMGEVSPHLTPAHLVVSIAAGVTLGALYRGLGGGRVIRVMPNTPCLLGAGASGFALGEDASEEDGRTVASLLEAVGVAVRVDEKLLDAVTGLSGSGPAYVYLAIEALSDGGVQAGLPRQVATQLAAQTLMGAAKMVLQSGEHPAVLKDRVASPGGTTIAGIQRLEQLGFRAALMEAVEAATARARQLGDSP